MVHASRTFRLFLSSTFSDLIDERNALHAHVFPALSDLALAYGARFHVVDLRWGVTDEAAFDHRTVRICLEEVERCQSTGLRPDFLILLGERYGWKPLPNDVPATAFEALKALCADRADSAELLRRWYARDDNAVPALYYLKARTGDFRDSAAWRDVEGRLLSLFESAVPVLASTHDCRSWGRSATEMEMRLGTFESPERAKDVHCFARTIEHSPDLLPVAAYVELDNAGHRDPSATAASHRLKREVSSWLTRSNFHDYRVQWSADGLDRRHLSAPESASGGFNLCAEVLSLLEPTLRRELESIQQDDPLTRELQEHETFARSRAAGFTGRQDVLAPIAAHLDTGSEQPLVVWGLPGSGKSALLARASIDARSATPGAQIVVRFIGLTPGSTDARRLLESVTRELCRKYGWDEHGVPTEYRDLIEDFGRRLRLIPEDTPLLLFFDALDQLSNADYGRNLAWLPETLPGAVRMIVSTLPAPETSYSVLATRLEKLPDNLLEVPQMPAREAAAMLQSVLDGLERPPSRFPVRRTLQRKQRSVAYRAFHRLRLPLYLKLVAEDARLWRSDAAAPTLASDIPGVIRALFARLSNRANHDPLVVSRSLGYLAAGRSGLTEDELLGVLSQDGEVMTSVKGQAHHELRAGQPIPTVLWSRLHFDLKPYLSERAADGAAVLSFFHRQFKEIVDADFLRDDERVQRHAGLARYFAGLPTVVQSGGRSGVHVRKLSELPYQQRTAHMWPELYATLTDLGFLEAKCAAGLTYDLVADYDAALADPLLPEEFRPTLEQFAAFVRAHTHVLHTHPRLFLQLAANEPDDTAPAQMVRRRFDELPDIAHFRWINKPQSLNRCLMTLDRHVDTVNTCAVSPSGEHIVSGASDAQLKVWERATGREVRTLAHPASIEMCVFSPAGDRLLTATRDGHVLMWDAVHYHLLWQRRLHAEPIANAAFSRDGRRFATASWDRTVAIHETNTGTLIRGLPQESEVLSCDFHPDGRSILCGTNEGRLRIWDLETWTERDGPAGHEGAIYRCAFSRDGRAIFSCAQDRTLKRWDAATFELAVTFTGHREAVWTFALSPDETRLVSGSDDKTLIAWDTATGAALAHFTGHRGAIWGTAFAPDGRTFVSAAWDWTVKVWSLAAVDTLAPSAAEGARGSTHTGTDSPSAGAVICCDASPDLRYYAAGSSDGHLRLWQARNAALVADVPAHTDYVLVVRFSPDSKSLVTASFNGSVKLFDVAARTFLDVGHHHQHLLSASFTEDGRVLVTASGNRINVWEVDHSGIRLVNGLEQSEPGFGACAVSPNGAWAVIGDEQGALDIRAMPSGEPLFALGRHEELSFAAVSPDGRRVATVGGDGTLKLWSVEERREIGMTRAHHRAIDACNFSHDGDRVVTAGWDALVRIWRVDALDSSIGLAGHVDQLQDAVFTPDGRKVLSASMDGTLRLWDAASGQELATLLAPGDSASVCAMSPDGRHVVSASHRSAVRVWSTGRGTLDRTLRGHLQDVRACAFSPDGSLLLTASSDRTLKLWDTNTWNEVRTYEGHAGPVWCCAFSPDGRSFASGSCDATVRIWSADSQQPLIALDTPEQWVRHLVWQDDRVIAASHTTLRIWDARTFAPTTDHDQGEVITSMAMARDGSQVMTGTARGVARIYDADPGLTPYVVGTHDSALKCCGFSPDGALAYTGAMDGSVRIWDVRQRIQLHVLTGHTSWVWSGAFAAGGDLLLSASEDHYVKVWDVVRGVPVCEYWVGAPARAIVIDPRSPLVAVGDATGHVHVLELVAKGYGVVV